MTTVWVASLSAAALPLAEASPTPPTSTNAANSGKVPDVHAMMPFTVSTSVLAKAGLDLLGVFQMADKGRTDRHEQCPQFGVLRVRDQGLVERIDHLLVIGDLML